MLCFCVCHDCTSPLHPVLRDRDLVCATAYNMSYKNDAMPPQVQYTHTRTNAMLYSACDTVHTIYVRKKRSKTEITHYL